MLNIGLEKPFLQNYLRTRLWQFYSLKKNIALASYYEGDQFLDRGNQRHSLYAGIRYEPQKGIEIIPLLGYSWDQRDDHLDMGISPALRIRARYRWPDGLEMQSQLWARVKKVEPRLQQNFHLESDLGKEFGKQAKMNVGLRAGSHQTDDYRRESVEQIHSDTAEIEFNWQYKLGEIWVWESANSLQLSQRLFDYENLENNLPQFNTKSFFQNYFSSFQQLSFAKNKLDGRLSFTFVQKARRYSIENSMEANPLQFRQLEEQEQRKSNEQSQLEWNLRLNWQPSDKHQFSLIGLNRYVRYDTPAENNYEDHDELSFRVSIDWNARWSRSFSTKYSFGGNFRQYAFLFAERSQDNYSQPALLFKFAYRWEPLPRLSLSGEQKIQVIYNVKDFTDRNFTDRSTRKLETRLKAESKLSKKWLSKASYYRLETHLSYLNWEAFSETTLDTSFIHIAEWVNEIRLPKIWDKTVLMADIGYKHFTQVRRLNTSMISLSNEFQSINLHLQNFQTGPTTGLRLRMKSPASISLSVWWQYQIHSNKFSQIDRVSTISTTYREEDLLEVNRKFIPFVQLKANLFL